MNTQAKELLLLSAVAFKSGKYEQASQLYAASMSADDADDMLESLAKQVEQTSGHRSLSSIVKEIEASISGDIQEPTSAPDPESDDLDQPENDDPIGDRGLDEFGASIDDEIWTDETDEDDPTELLPVTSLSVSTVVQKPKIKV